MLDETKQPINLVVERLARQEAEFLSMTKIDLGDPRRKLDELAGYLSIVLPEIDWIEQANDYRDKPNPIELIKHAALMEFEEAKQKAVQEL